MIESNSVIDIPNVRKYFIDLLIAKIKTDKWKAEEYKDFHFRQLIERVNSLPLLEIFHEDVIQSFSKCRHLEYFQAISTAFSNPELEPLINAHEINPIRAELLFHIAEYYFEEDKTIAYRYYSKAAELKHPQAKIRMNTEPFFAIQEQEAKLNFLQEHNDIRNKQRFHFLRSTKIDPNLDFAAILAHGMQHKSRTRDIFVAKGWLKRNGNINIDNAPPFVIQAAQKNLGTLVIDIR